MNIILIISSLMLLIFFILFTNKDFANPGFIYLSVWLVSVVSSFLLSKDLDISFKTVTVIIIGNLLFSSGILISERLVVSRTSKVNNNFVENSYIPSWMSFVIIIFLIIMFLYVYKDLMRVSLFVERSTEFNKVLEGARYASTRGLARVSYLVANLLRLNYSLGVVYFYYYVKELFYPKRSKINKLLLLIVSVISLSGSILSSGRSELLGMLSAYLFIILVFYSYKLAWHDVRYSQKILKILVYTGTVFISLFLFVGVFILNRTGASQGETIFSNLFKYLGSSILALDFYLNNRYLYPTPEIIGQNTFLALFSTLSSLGLYNGPREVFLQMINIAGTRTNVYTLYYYFIQDFGYVLSMIFQFLYGGIFGLFYFYIKKRNFSRFMIIVYALLSQALVMSFFAEQLFSVLTNHITRVFFVGLILIVIKISNMFKIKV